MRPVEQEVCRCDVGQRHGLDERIRRDSEAHVDLYLSCQLLTLVKNLSLRGSPKIIVAPLKRACRINPASMTLLSATFLSRWAVTYNALTDCYLSCSPSVARRNQSIIYTIKMEKGPLLGELPRKTAAPNLRRILTAIRVLAFTFAASFAACYSWTGYWPLDYVMYSPAERVLIRNPLIGVYLLSSSCLIVLGPVSSQALVSCTDLF